jgi:hypothetical protein
MQRAMGQAVSNPKPLHLNIFGMRLVKDKVVVYGGHFAFF